MEHEGLSKFISDRIATEISLETIEIEPEHFYNAAQNAVVDFVSDKAAQYLDVSDDE